MMNIGGAVLFTIEGSSGGINPELASGQGTRKEKTQE